MKVGVIETTLDPLARRESYAADATYGTNSEFGFDYLRDNMAVQLADTVQRGYNFCIVRRGRLDPHRRGAHAADHLRDPGGGGRHLLPVRASSRRCASAPTTRSTRRRARRRPPRAASRRSSGRSVWRTSTWTATGSWSTTYPGPEGARALPPRQGVHRPGRRGAHRRRVHRAGARGPALRRACTRPSRPRKACGSARRTRRSRRSPSRTTSACTRSCRG